MTLAIWEDSEKLALVEQGAEIHHKTVAMLPNGGYVLGWREGTTVKFEIFDGHGQPTGAVKTLPGTASQHNFSIDVLRNDELWADDGRIIISWNESTIVDGRALYSVKSQVFDLSGNIPEGASTEVIATDLTLTGTETPSVARNHDGGYVTAFDAGDQVRLSVHFRSGEVAAHALIDDAQGVENPDVTYLGPDKFVVSYSISGALFFKMVDLKKNPAEWTRVDPEVSSLHSDVVVTKNAAGVATGFALISKSDNRIETRIYDNAGVQVGSAIILTTESQNTGKPFSAVALKDGRIAVAYAQDWPGDDEGDIYVQIIDPSKQDDPNTPTDDRLSAPIWAHADAAGKQHTPSISEMEDGRLIISWMTDIPDAPEKVSTVIVDPRSTPVTTRGTIRDDVFVGSEHPGDELAGNYGNDTLVGSLGADTMHGGADTDTVSYQYAKTAVIFVLREGEVGGIGGAEAAGDVYTSIENAIGSNYDDQITGNAGANKLEGGAGNDVLDGGAGDDTLLGGTGDDAYYVDSRGDKVVETSSSHGTDHVYASVDYTLGNLVEHLALRGMATRGTGNTLANKIDGNASDNILKGNTGNDTLGGGGGADTMDGGTGNDVFYVDRSTDRIVETSSGGTDRLYTSASYTLAASAYVESMSIDDPLDFTPINLTGNNIAQTITGNAGANVLSGLGGNDVLSGGAGLDTLDGGTGNDAFYVDRSTDKIVETSSGGTDRLYTSASYALAASAYVESMSTTSSSGTAAINLKGNNIAQRITGNAGTNTLTGLGGNDVINGGSGSDRIYGGTGNDVLYGGGTDARRDTFVFNTALRSNVDTIKDFSTRYDRIELDNDIFKRAGSLGTLKSDAFVAASRAQDREDRIIYDRAKGYLYYDADGTGSTAAVKFAQVSKGLAMSYSDFIVIS